LVIKKHFFWRTSIVYEVIGPVKLNKAYHKHFLFFFRILLIVPTQEKN